MLLAYDVAYTIAAIATSPIWAFRMLQTGKWRTDWPARFGRCDLPDDTERRTRTVLIHAVSVGEVNAVRLLVDRLAERAPQARIVISTTTDTGTERARRLFEPRFKVVRYPLDFSACVGRFLDRVRPDLVALVENEVWPNFTSRCARRRIPVCVINGRLSEHSFKRYRLIKPVARAMFGRLTAAAVQSRADADRFTALGTPADRVRVLDTMKWDTAQVSDRVAGAGELARAMGIDRSKPVLVAGSTAPGEEKLLIDTCSSPAQLVLVPRRPERFKQVAQMVPGIVRRSEHPDGTDRPQDGQRLFLLDTMGELRKAYALADVALVGRSFLGLHGSDMIEPIALGKPTIIGTHHSNFADTMAALVAEHGIEVSNDPGPLAADLLAHRDRAADLARRGREVILTRQGSTDRHVELLMELLGKENGGRGTGTRDEG